MISIKKRINRIKKYAKQRFINYIIRNFFSDNSDPLERLDGDRFNSDLCLLIASKLSDESLNLLRYIQKQSCLASITDERIVPLDELKLAGSAIYRYDNSSHPFSLPFFANGQINLTHPDVKTLRRNKLIRIGRGCEIAWDDGKRSSVNSAFERTRVELTPLGLAVLNYKQERG